MRPFRKRQITNYKCTFCGGMNRKVGDLVRGDKVVGFNMQCCECGHLDNFVAPGYDYRDVFGHKLAYVNRQCIRNKPCRHSDCELYVGKDGDKNSCGMPNCTCGNNCSCNSGYNGNSNNPELSVNQINGPRFH